jgi:aminopeptidase-like protein
MKNQRGPAHEPEAHGSSAPAQAPETGASLHRLVEELYPICRSITGDGVRATLDILERFVPLTRTELPTGTPILDWTVPNEWNIRDAYVKDASGRRVIDFRAHNLHVVSYSAPVRGTFSLAALRPHLFSLPEQPALIPYRTSYYAESWGFCLSHRQLQALPDGDYEVCIDSSLAPGSLTWGEFVLPGQSEEEILISTHVCHPSLCDDNLTGLAISVHLARALAALPQRRYTMRFLYAPGTIGAIAWLAQNEQRRIKAGLTLTCLGDSHPFTYKKTVQGDSEVDRAAARALKESGLPHQQIEFFPYGYDERQYNSPGFRMPVGSLMRGRHGTFPEYHTSADDLSFVSADRMLESLTLLHRIVDILDGNASYRNLAPYGEPQLGKRGLYEAMGGTNIPDLQLALLWVLNLSDGKHSLLDIAERAAMPFATIRHAADLLIAGALLA